MNVSVESGSHSTMTPRMIVVGAEHKSRATGDRGRQTTRTLLTPEVDDEGGRNRTLHCMAPMRGNSKSCSRDAAIVWRRHSLAGPHRACPSPVSHESPEHVDEVWSRSNALARLEPVKDGMQAHLHGAACTPECPRNRQAFCYAGDYQSQFQPDDGH